MENNNIDPNEVFTNKYFVLNKQMLRLISFWPYQKTWKKLLSRVCLAITILSMMIPQMTRAIEECLNEDVNTELVLENFGGFCYFLTVISKCVTFLYTQHNLQRIYEEVTKDWKEITDEGEKNVLRHFADEGRLLTILWSVYVYGSAILYILSTAAIPCILNAILKPEEPFKLALCYYAEYFIDQEKYFVYLFFHTLIAGTATVAVSSGIDSAYVVCVQHVLGLFNIIKYKLEELQTIVSDPDRYNSPDIEDVINENIMYCLNIHKRCLEFTDWLQNTYSHCFFFVVAIIVTGLTTLSVDMVLSIDRPINFIRIFVLWLAAIIYMFFVSWPGQKMIDTSNELFLWLYSSEWYQFPLKNQKHIKFMMLRAKNPCQLTAGPLLVMNFETCSFMLRSTFSYFTAVASMQ